MKKINSNTLLDFMKSDCRQTILFASRLLQENPATLLTQPVPGSWSVAQVIAHLNSYNRYYLPLMERRIAGNSLPGKDYYTPGWMGSFFTKTMRPGKDGRVHYKMKTPKAYRPIPALDVKAVIDEFIREQHRLLRLLGEAEQKDLDAIRIPISIIKLVKIKLGDCFSFLIAHQLRHFVQVQAALDLLRNVTISGENVEKAIG